MIEVVHVLKDAEKIRQAMREGRYVSIHRPSVWGNPFSHKEKSIAAYRVDTRADAIRSYEKWILCQSELLSRLHELRDKVLGCFCVPLSCHGHILARLAEPPPLDSGKQLALF